jgi:hypothetical protein
MRQLGRFLYKSGLIWILVFPTVGILNIYFPSSMIPRPEGNGLLLGLWEAAVFVIRPGTFIFPALFTLIALALLLPCPCDWKYIKEVWQKSA